VGLSLRIALALAVLGGVAYAQRPFPAAPITIVVPFSAGGSADFATRLYADVVSRSTGYRLVIENKPGGGGVVAAMAVKAARPDGYTLRLADIGPDTVLPSMQPIDYDPLEDFRQITMLFSWPQFLVVPASSTAKSAADVITLAKNKPHGLNCGTQGVGAGGDLLCAMFQMATKAPLVRVPYKGGGPLALDLATGRIDMAFAAYREYQAAAADGKVRFLAVASPHRVPVMPAVPTMAEAGLPSVELSPWFGLDAPAGTPDAVISKLHDAFAAAAKDRALARRLTEEAIETRIDTPAEFAKFIAGERTRLGAVIVAAGIRTQ
jgi:tripartite-type tricarboxylate transporter receptor subunit TctC